MRYYSYDVDPSFVMGGSTIKWQITGCGEYVLGTKGRKKYFIKRNMHLRYPSKGEPKAVYDAKKAPCEVVEKKQKELNRRMKHFDPESDRIVLEEDNFWDDEARFVTVTRHIAGAVASDSDFSGLSFDDYLKLITDLTERIEMLHKAKVIHGDLKLKNILFKPKGSSYETYLIDFDSSYPNDAIPTFDTIGGTEGYLSPEILLYRSDEGAAPASTITYATDIFTLGIMNFFVIALCSVKGPKNISNGAVR